MITLLKNRTTLVVLGLLLAALLRLWNLGSIPPGLTPDEAALGYNSYSILQTGRDEYGVRLPLIFKSFGDYKPGLYVYFSMPFVAIFGLNEFSIRLASAFSGVFTAYLIYLICKNIFKEEIVGLLTLFFVAFNPWLIYFGRGAWEANLSLTLTLGGIYFFLKSLDKNKFLIYSSILFGLTLLTYQGAKISTLIVLAVLLAFNWKQFWNIERKYLAKSLVFGLVLAIPIFMTFIKGQTFRLNIYSIFSYHRPEVEISTILNQDGLKSPNFLFNSVHSEGVNYLRAILGRYFNNFSGRFLFFEGDWANPISTAPYQGVLLLIDIILLPLGIYAIFKNKYQKFGWFIFTWVLMAPLSSAFSRDELNAVRDLNLAVPLVMVTVFGALEFVSILQRFLGKRLSVLVFGGFYVVSVLYFIDAYFVHTPAHNSSLWRYGFKESVLFVTENKNKYSKVYFEQSFNQPYIYFLFYGPKNPLKYQSQKLVDSEYKGDVGYITELDNVVFTKIDWQKIKNEHNVLVVANHTSVPPEFFKDTDTHKLVYSLNYLNGRDGAFDAIEIK